MIELVLSLMPGIVAMRSPGVPFSSMPCADNFATGAAAAKKLEQTSSAVLNSTCLRIMFFPLVAMRPVRKSVTCPEDRFSAGFSGRPSGKLLQCLFADKCQHSKLLAHLARQSQMFDLLRETVTFHLVACLCVRVRKHLVETVVDQKA